MRAIWIKELARALAKQSRVIGWVPRFLPQFPRVLETEAEGVRTIRFPLLRGFGRFPLRYVEGPRVAARLAAEDAEAALIATAPHYVRSLKRWKGPRIYHATDMFSFYGERYERIQALEASMCRHAHVIAANSDRILNYLRELNGGDDDRFLLLPNATRESNLLPQPLSAAASVPSALEGLPRPIAGVIGNLAANIDWVFIHEVVDATPWLSWAFVGPTTMPAADPRHGSIRASLMGDKNGRLRFVGGQPYEALAAFARSFDVALIPYVAKEPTISGSPTRFFEHLAATRPILATDASPELRGKEPLVTIVENTERAVEVLESLRDMGFDDGHGLARWTESLHNTWEERATTLRLFVSKFEF